MKRRWTPQEKEEFLKEEEKRHNESVNSFCRRYNIGTHTLYRWKKRYIEEGFEGLKDRPRGAKKPAKTKKRRSPKEKLSILKEILNSSGSLLYRCSKFGIGTRTYYEWLTRYEKEGLEGLVCRSSRPHNIPKKTSKEVEKKVLSVKKVHRHMGIAQLSQYLKRFLKIRISPKTISSIFKKHNVDKVPPQPKEKKTDWIRFERELPNQLWQMDITTFRIKKLKVYIIAVLDDASRYMLKCRLSLNMTGTTVLEVLQDAINIYGKPSEVLTDRGSQFYNKNGIGKFQEALIRVQIKHILASPEHPQTLGKVESFWRNLKRELLSRIIFKDFNEAETQISIWQEYYNHGRTHMALGGRTPADVYFEKPKEPKNRPKNFYLIGSIGGKLIKIEKKEGRILFWVERTQILEI